MKKGDPEKVAQQQKDLDLVQTLQMTEDMRVDEDDLEKDAQEQMEQNSEQTLSGNEEFQDVTEGDSEKDSPDQKDHNSGQNAAGNEDVQEVNKDDSVQGNDKVDEMENGNMQNIILSRQEVNTLRKDVQKWLELHQSFGRDDVCLAVKELIDLRQKYNVPPLLWQKEVISLRDVQERLNWIMEYMKITPDEKQRKELLGSFREILGSCPNTETAKYPEIRKVTEMIKLLEGTSLFLPLEIEDIADLPEILTTELKRIGNKDFLNLISLQGSLEASLRLMARAGMKTYEYLVCISVLQLFGFDLLDCVLEQYLSKNDFKNITDILVDQLRNLHDMRSKCERQAYVLNLALCKVQQGETVQHLIELMPGGLCTELQAMDLESLKAAVDGVLSEKTPWFELETLLHSFKQQFHFVDRSTKCTDRYDAEEADIDKAVVRILKALGLKRYYPQKLKYEDVIMLTSSIHDDINKKPASLPELPWYFMKHVIGVDSNTRESCHVMGSEEDMSDSSDNDDEDDNRDSDSQIHAVHTLDLIYTIFLCADDFLRQELADKMSRCQYAVPLILPSPQQEQDQTKSLMLHWGLKSITRNFCHRDTVVNKNLLDTEAPLVACVSLGEETYWETKLINAMLSPQQEAFWHRGLKGGNFKQMVSEGMVEVAWYLPGRHGENTFPYPVTFANLRQSVTNSNAVCESLCSAATVSCFFTEEVNNDVTSILKTIQNPGNIILVVLHSKWNEKRVKEKCKQLQTTLKLESHQIIRKQAGGENFNPVYEKLKKAIEQMTRSFGATSLSAFVKNMKETDVMDVDDFKCYHGEMAARAILKDIDKYNNRNFGHAKAETLPCQSDLSARQQMAALDKELCRQRKCGENTTVQSYAFKTKEKKWQLQLDQLRKPVSTPFKYFLQCIHSLNSSDRNYFLQSLKLGLNARSVEQLQPLYEEYEKLRAADESEERERRLKEIDKQLTHGSLGLEHFFRETAILYENALALRDKMASHDSENVICNSFDKILDSVSNAMAGALKDGTAIEIMDGDAVHVPVQWLTAVLNRIEDYSNSKILKIAVLGAQSCGKSTLLNTVFGLNFPVSSGRCTRGAYMQLVKVDASLKETLKCDYVAVIDSEGLMSRTKTDDSDYDNELSTFIIGLSDLTLVIIKGEGNEMNDVLPLAIHVFLRMNIVGEKQACHFVHQNMGAVDAMTKISTEIDAFVRDLNAKTLAAAKDTDQSDQYKRFTDILKYDPNNDNTYVPGLWDGTPPMGKTNAYYSQTMQRLKSHIITTTMNMQINARKGLSTFEDFAKRLHEVWNAIKHEDFVLSFKNVLAVEAHKKLTRVFDQEQWTIKREIREMMQEAVNIIENEVKEGNSQRTVKQMTSASLLKLTTYLDGKINKMEENIMHYFQCTSCKDCDNDVQNRHLLINNEKEFEDDVRALKRSITREMEETMDNIEIKMTTDDHINRLSAEVDSILNKKVKEVIASRTSESMDPQAIERTFDTLWEEATRDIMTLKYIEKDPGIEGIVQATIRKVLGHDDHHYRQKRVRISSQMDRQDLKFHVDSNRHMQPKGYFPRTQKFLGIAFVDEDVQRLQSETDKIVGETAKYYDGTYSPDGRQFCRKDVELLFKDVKERIEQIEDEQYKITKKYEMNLIFYIEKRAVEGFTMMHKKYYQSNNPKVLLEKKKKSFHDLLAIKMGQGNAAAKFCDTVLRDIILKNIEEQLSCTELLHDLRIHCGEMFRDIKSIQASIMVNLLRENKVTRYLEYITNYETCVKFEMEKEWIQHFTQNNRLKELAKIKLDQLIAKILQAVEKTVDRSSHEANFITTLFRKIDHLKISHDDAAGYRELDVADKQGFSGIIQQQLNGTVREDLLKEINSWDVLWKLYKKNLTDFLFTEVVGCSERCPFCKVPCDAHSGGKCGGNHSATLHRPKGLGGFGWERTNKLVENDCSFSIAAGLRFRNEMTHGEWHKYRYYHQIYPNWSIHGSADPDVEKYWKWVFARHNEEFAKYYSREPADIPPEWEKYTSNDIKKDIEDNYHIEADI